MCDMIVGTNKIIPQKIINTLFFNRFEKVGCIPSEIRLCRRKKYETDDSDTMLQRSKNS